MAFDKTIQMYIFDGDPNGRIMCELSNWNGRLYKIARAQLSQFAARADAENTGVYFLFGRNDDGEDAVYIGEAEKILTRLKQHLNEEFWNDCVVVISKDDLLNKAHIKYLENSFYMLAKDSGRFKITNSTVPTRSSISEYDEAMLEEFISNTKLLVNALGYKVFDTLSRKIEKPEKAPETFFLKNSRNAKAKGVSAPDGFVVLAGSSVSEDTVPSMSLPLLRKREELIQSGVIDAQHRLTRNYIFTSPSTAAAVVLGRNANGRTEWRTASGKALKDIEEGI